MNIIASIARYHDDEFPMDSQENYYILSDKEKMTVSILAAILKLSEALDASHLQKIQELKLTIDGDNLYFNLTAKEDVVLEEWNFMNYVNFFEEVIGVKPII
jgi:exopolyphosphatase/guanosine-5'-triphosphate,3'-diphosphate pyrophosphatase